jgi:phosphopantetheinyl transferase
VPRGVDVWIVPLDRPESEVERLYGLLSADERERAGRPPHAPRKRRYVVRQGATREILARYTEAPPEALELVRSSAGKPSLAGAGELRFSVSDSADLALVAVARRDVGVDLEQVRDRAAVRRMRALGRERFFERWTRLEAVGKARGSGMLRLRRPGADVTCHSLSVAPGFAAAVALAGDGLDVRLRPY